VSTIPPASNADELGTQKECKGEDPIPDQHKKERPLKGREAEIFDARVAAAPRPASQIAALFDETCSFSQRPTVIKLC
jgi:hypothetical protein